MTDNDNGGSNGNGNGNKASKVAILSSNTLVPLGAVFLVFMAAWNVQSFMEKKFQAMQEHLNTIDRKYTDFNYTVNNQLDAIRSSMVNRWTSQDMKIWEQELKIRNPSIDVPNSTDITRSRAVTTETPRR